jgi:catechol 2,3-dioxygenase-like lactoylglutathione lyase family enzyme
MELDHINISAPQDLLDEVKAFYCHVFQLEQGERPDFGIPGYWLYAGDRPIVHLVVSDNHVAVPNPHLDHVAFRASGLAEFEQRLASIDCHFDKLEGLLDNVVQLFFRDPAGIQLEANVTL